MRKKALSLIIIVVLIIGMIPAAVFADEDYPNSGVRDYVIRLYNVVLERNPDRIGMNDWYNRITTGRISAGDAALGFFHSNEYFSRQRSNDEFVTDLYKTFLGRNPDRIGFADWTNRLANGASRDQVMKGFIYSVEFAEICRGYGISATQAVRWNGASASTAPSATPAAAPTSTPAASSSAAAGTTIPSPSSATAASSASSSATTQSNDGTPNVEGFVTRLYNVALGRNPDRVGFADWVNRLTTHQASPSQVARGFIFSAECISATTDNTVFVTTLYRAILGRNPDRIGLADWTNRLANGTSRESVFEGFVNSTEFRGICESFGLGRSIDPTRPMIALTFDDGPAGRTGELLDALENAGQAATFFVVGSNARIYQNTLRRMDSIGCEIGNHTYDHPYLTRQTADGVRNQIERTNEQIRNAVGYNAPVMRPPYGAHNATVDSNVGTPLILWSIDTRDWATRSTQSTIDAVLNNVRDGDIVLMHDIHTSTVDAAIYLIPELVRRGYQLVTVSELAEYRGGAAAGRAYSSFRP